MTFFYQLAKITHIPPRVLKYWVAPMFTYGFFRTARSEYPVGFDLLTHRLVWSTVQGVLYASPVGVFKLLSTVDRVQIKWSDRPRELYPNSYTDGVTKNERVFI